MKHGFHPIHSHPVDIEPFGIENVVVFDGRLDPEKPVFLDDAMVVFSDPWKAARFLENKSQNRTGFSATEETPAQLLALSPRPAALVLDPCASCGFHSKIEILAETTPAELKTLLQKEMFENRVRRETYKNSGKLLMQHGRDEEAFELFAVVARHLAPGDPEIHFLIAECGLRLKDLKAVETAKANLQNIDPSWLAKLPK